MGLFKEPGWKSRVAGRKHNMLGKQREVFDLDIPKWFHGNIDDAMINMELDRRVNRVPVPGDMVTLRDAGELETFFDWGVSPPAPRPKFKTDLNFNEFVDELRKSREDVWNNYLSRYTELGSGHFSRVYACPWDDDKVIKVSKARPEDDGWLEWAGFCIQHAGQPMLPVIHNLVIEETYYVALLDRHLMTMSEAMQAAPHIHGTAMSALREVWPALIDYAPYRADEMVALAAYRLKDKINAASLSMNDVRDENIMINRKGGVVLTDPIGCSRSDPRGKLRSLGVTVYPQNIKTKEERHKDNWMQCLEAAKARMIAGGIWQPVNRGKAVVFGVDIC